MARGLARGIRAYERPRAAGLVLGTAGLVLVVAGRFGDRLLGHGTSQFGWGQTTILGLGIVLVVAGAALVPLKPRAGVRRPGLGWLPWPIICGAGAFILWSRLASLDQSLWHDEVFSVVHYSSRGPNAIFFDEYIPNNHVLFNLLAWATTSVSGESEIAYRLWSVVPAIAAVVVVVWWTWRILDPWTSVAVAVFVATSPIHHDLTREARGYGLTFLAGALMLVFAYKVGRGGGRRDLFALGVAGVIGGLTVPQFAIGFVGQTVPLLMRRDLRRRALAMLAAVGGVLLVLYAPVLSDMVRSADTVSGSALPWHGPVSAALKDLLQPSFDVLANRRTDAYFVTSHRPDQLLAGALALIGGVLLWRAGARLLLALLVVPVVFTYSVLTATGLHVHERYGSFLLFHTLILAAVAVVRGVQAFPRGAARYAATGAAVVIAGLTVAHALTRSRRFHDMPREDFKRVARVVKAQGATRVVTDSARPIGLQYYMGGSKVSALPGSWLRAFFCSSRAGDIPPEVRGLRDAVLKPPVVFVEHPFAASEESADAICLERRGATSVTVHQRDRGERIVIWFLPRSGAGTRVEP